MGLERKKAAESVNTKNMREDELKKDGIFMVFQSIKYSDIF